MSKQEIERWIKENTFKCLHLGARISPWQCKANRKKMDLNQKSNYFAKNSQMPDACKNCNVWKKYCKN